MTSALDDALQWNCPICTFLNPLDANQCAMCNNPRPRDQYLKLIEIREEAKRQKRIQEELLRQQAMNANAMLITNQTTNNNNNTNNADQDDQLAAQQLLDDDDQDWDDDDFGDDDDDFGDDDDDKSIDMIDKTNQNDIKDADDDKNDNDNDDDDDDDGGWGNINDANDIGMTDMKVPQKKELFQILTANKLHEYQVSIMKEVADSLYISDLDDVGIMLRYYRWNKSQLMDEYLINPTKIKKKCGIISSSPVQNISSTVVQSPLTFDCMLCIRTIQNPSLLTFYPSQCGHQYCSSCWLNYLISAMSLGPKCIFTKCIEPSCKLIIRSNIFLNFFQNHYKHRLKYNEYILNSFVSGMPSLQWCPGPGCIMCVKSEFGSPISIDCSSCHYLWCFKCISVAHLPCNCSLAEKWLKLHSTDSENITYVRAFTKQCPKCKNHIEKNNGCNHMTCRCGYEFCWLCRKDWKKIGYGHQCNKPAHVLQEEKDQKNAQSYLKRFMFYCARYEAHEKSANFAKKSIKNAKECIRQFIINKINNKSYKYNDLEFIQDAIIEIIKCRHILQWSYCYGYYLSDNCSLKVLFETQQGLLESFSDQLHEKAEKRVDDPNQWYTLTDIKFRTQLMDLTRAVKKYRKNFCDSLLDSDLPFIFQTGLT